MACRRRGTRWDVWLSRRVECTVKHWTQDWGEPRDRLRSRRARAVGGGPRAAEVEGANGGRGLPLGRQRQLRVDDDGKLQSMRLYRSGRERIQGYRRRR
jgi:hypothetical protein